MAISEEELNRAVALSKWPLTVTQMLAVAAKVESGELKVTFDQFGNGQVPVMMPDADSQSFQPQMRRFDMNAMMKEEEAAGIELDKAVQDFEKAKKKRAACNVFINALRAAKEEALPKSLD